MRSSSPKKVIVPPSGTGATLATYVRLLPSCTGLAEVETETSGVVREGTVVVVVVVTGAEPFV